MNPYQYITQHPERTISILGITSEQFNALAEQAIDREKEYRDQQEQQKRRVNRKGAGSPKSLSSMEEICMTLFYLNEPCKFEVLGMHFDVSKTTANDRFHYWLKFIRNLLPASLVEEASTPLELSELQAMLKEQELIVDSFEQERSTPIPSQERIY